MSLLWTFPYHHDDQTTHVAIIWLHHSTDSPANSPISYSTDATVLSIPVIVKAQMETIY